MITAPNPVTSQQIDGETMETMRDFIFFGSQITAVMTAAMKLKDACSLKKSYDNTRLRGASVRNPTCDKVMQKEA